MTGRRRASRFAVVVEQGSPRGDLYELDQTTVFCIMERRSRKVVMTLRGEMAASLSRDTGQWDDYRFSGVQEVTISTDDKAAIVTYHDGREESVPLPPPSAATPRR